MKQADKNYDAVSLGIDDLAYSPKEHHWDIGPLLNPRSIALIGCSGNVNGLSGRPLKYLLDSNYAGKVYPVNPKYDEIEGIRCYSNIEEIPEPVDVAMLLIPTSAVENTFESCIRAKTKSVIIVSAGFAELGEEGKSIQTRIRNLSQKENLPILGPNCLGCINIADNIPLTFSELVEEDLRQGSLALVSQSGALAAWILGDAHRSKIGISYWVTTGNEVSLEASEVVKQLIEKNDVSTALLYLEESRNPQGLIEAGLKARELGKYLICLKVGRSSAGKKAAMSHTGALSGSDEEYDAVLKKAGIVRASNIQELLDFGVVFSQCGLPKGNRVGIVTISGGGGIIVADHCEKMGLKVPELSPEIKSKLIEVVPSFGSAENPVDVTASALIKPGLLKESIDILISDKNIDSIVVFLGAQKRNAASISKDLIEVVKKSKSASGPVKPLIVCWMHAPDNAVEILREAGVPVLPEGTRVVNALAKLVHTSDAVEFRQDDEAAQPILINDSIRDQLLSYRKEVSEEPCVLSEFESKQFLSSVGIKIPKSGIVESREAAVELAEKLKYPLVAKVNSPDIAHKSDASAVAVGIKNSEEIKKAFDDIIQNSKNYNPQAKICGVLVEKMVQGGVETIIGYRWSDQFGPIIMLGMGGIFVELLKDITFRIAPVTYHEALQMIGELKTSKLFFGFRGSAKCDIQALAKTIVMISEVGAKLGKDLKELDINPLFVLEENNGVMAGDALIVL